jgi:hypothetical protein
MNNDMVGLIIPLKLFNEMEPAIKHFKDLMNKRKNSLEPFGLLFLFNIVLSLPSGLAKFFVDL